MANRLVPDELVDSVDRLAGNFAICPLSLSQLAAFEAYDELDANVSRHGVNRAMVAGNAAADRSRQIGSRGWRVLHLYRRVRWTDNSLAFVARALAECVAIAPGMDFDPVDGGRYVRMCFAGDATEIGQGITWLGGWLARQPLR
jgi:aspartate/methionine/tyrosine aminotransferase